jgi:2-oxoglutarate ferredoxin oxidoreductase subunit delta
MAGKITIDFERCKGCGLCVAVCPKASIAISKQSNRSGYFPAQANNKDCTGCCACAIVCPDAAIVVYRDDPKEIKNSKCKIKNCGTGKKIKRVKR